MGKITVDTYAWDNFEKEMAQEKRIVAIIESWAEIENPPIDIYLMTYSASYVNVRPFQTDVTDVDKHKLLAWFVRLSGKKFLKHMRSNSELIWWNYSNFDKVDNDLFKDAQGELRALIMIENAALGKCRFVEKTKTVKYKELVCDEVES